MIYLKLLFSKSRNNFSINIEKDCLVFSIQKMKNYFFLSDFFFKLKKARFLRIASFHRLY